jgi:hypothetical protein
MPACSQSWATAWAISLSRRSRPVGACISTLKPLPTPASASSALALFRSYA